MTYYVATYSSAKGWRISRIENGIEADVCGAVDETVARAQVDIFNRLVR